MTVAALLLALAWSFGYITLAVGHLNILSIAFAVILIGLGIDFGIHYVARYLQLRTRIHSSDEALAQTASSVGPGIVTGAVTTAIAFFMAGFTEFTGVAELGLIAGGGILLCCVAALIVLPAMVHLSDAARLHQVLPAPLDIHGWLRPLFAKPRLVLAVTLAGTAAVALGMSRLEYDHNLLNLQAEGLESVELEQKLLTESDQSVWFALSIAESREELLARKAEFLKSPSVERVEEIASLLPVDHEQKRPIIQRIQKRLEDLPERPPEIPVDPPAELGRALARAQILLDSSPASLRIDRRLEEVRDALRRLTVHECHQRLRECQHGLASDLLSRLFRIRSMANPEPPKLDDLPEGLVTPIRRPGLAASAPLPHEDLQQGKHLGHGRDAGVRPASASGRPQGDRQPAANVRGLASDEGQLREGRVVRSWGYSDRLDDRLRQCPLHPLGHAAAGDRNDADLRPARPSGHPTQPGQHDRPAVDPGYRDRRRGFTSSTTSDANEAPTE